MTDTITNPIPDACLSSGTFIDSHDPVIIEIARKQRMDCRMT